MAPKTLLLAIHNHQPDGNFDEVFAQSHDQCYAPVVDDEELVRNMAKSTLERCGYSVEVAGDGQAAAIHLPSHLPTRAPANGTVPHE